MQNIAEGPSPESGQPARGKNPFGGAGARGSEYGRSTEVTDGKVHGDVLTWQLSVFMPESTTLSFEATVTGDTMSGTVNAGSIDGFRLTGTRS